MTSPTATLAQPRLRAGLALSVLALAWALALGSVPLALTVLLALLVGLRPRELRLLYALAAPLWGHRVFLRTLLRVSRVGDAMLPVVSFRLWPLARHPVLLVNDPALVREVVQQGALFHTMGGENPAIVALLGPQGLFTTQATDSPEWRRRRRVTDPLLSGDPLYTARIFTDLLAASRTYAADWHGHQPGLLVAIARVMLPAQSLALFAEPFTPERHRQAGADLLANFRGIGEGLFFALTDRLRRPWTRHHLARSWDYIADITAVITADARAASPDEARPGMFRLLSTALRDGTYDDAEVRDTVALFLNAGAPIHLVFWTLHTLAHHRDVETDLVAEIRRATATGPLTFARLAELPRLRAVLLEVMRLYPPVPLFQPRRAARDTTLGDTPVAAGTQLLLCPYVFQRNPALTADVESFRPDRTGNALTAAHMLPFSVGARTCQGRQFAMLAATAALVAILERHTLHLDERVPCPHPSEAVYCRPSHDIAFSASPRPHTDAPADAATHTAPASRCPFHALFAR